MSVGGLSEDTLHGFRGGGGRFRVRSGLSWVTLSADLSRPEGRSRGAVSELASVESVGVVGCKCSLQLFGRSVNKASCGLDDIAFSIVDASCDAFVVRNVVSGGWEGDFDGNPALYIRYVGGLPKDQVESSQNSGRSAQ